MSTAKQALCLFFAIIISACSGWYFASKPGFKKLDEHTLANTADSIINDLVIRRFDEKGSLASFLESPKMEHIPNQNTNYFESPHIILAEEKQSDWDIRSESAKAIHKGDEIQFKGHVIIHQDKDAHTEASTLKTEALTYFPKQKFATTLLAVVFEQQGSIIHSIGMNAYLENKHVELLGKTHATYKPNHG